MADVMLTATARVNQVAIEKWVFDRLFLPQQLTPMEQKEFARLVTDLGNDDYFARQKSQALLQLRLQTWGSRALKSMQQAIANETDIEIKKRLELAVSSTLVEFTPLRLLDEMTQRKFPIENQAKINFLKMVSTADTKNVFADFIRRRLAELQ